MAFERGHKKLGGRKAGTLNKASIVAQERLEKLGFDPIDFLVTIARNTNAELSLRFNAAKELLQYACPKLKSTEIAISEDPSKRFETMSDQELEEVCLRLTFAKIRESEDYQSKILEEIRALKSNTRAPED